MNLTTKKNEPQLFSNTLPQKYIYELAGSLTSNTKRAYLGDIKRFYDISDFSELTLDMVQGVDVERANKYIDKLVEQGKKPSTINRSIRALSKFYRYLCRREIGIMTYNPFSSDEGINIFKIGNQSTGRALLDDEVIKFIEVINEDKSIIGLRNKIIILMLATTGMRRSEVSGTKIGQISVSEGEYIINAVGKGRKTRIVVISKGLKIYIDKYLEARGLTYKDKNKPLFDNHSSNGEENSGISHQTVYRAVKGIANKAGLEVDNISPHSLRHTYITNSLKEGCPLEDVQDRVGHADPSTTRRYDHLRRIINNNPADKFLEKFDK